MSAFAPALQAFFTDRLISQRNASPHTISSYRDTFRLLLRFATDQTGTAPSELDIDDVNAALVTTFLTHLSQQRHNSPATRNNRLAAIHSLFAYLALRHPEHAGTIQRVLAIPRQRVDRTLVTYLTDEEVDALLDAPDRDRWIGRRDHAMFALMIQTGLRISELANLTCADVITDRGAHVRTTGKGRKHRHTPLLPLIVDILQAWLAERHGRPDEPLFATSTGRKLSHDAITKRLAVHLATARRNCPSLASKHVTPHTLRHTAAMRLLLSGVDVTVIALWLGHEQLSSTNIYLHADLAQKEQALAATTPPNTAPGRYHPPDPLLAFLEAL